MNPSVLVVTQPRFPVPAVNDGAAAIIIQDTLECLPGCPIQSISLWDERLRQLPALPEQCRFIRPKTLAFRAMRRLTTGHLVKKYGAAKDHPHSLMLSGLFAYRVRSVPRVVVVHTTKWEWVLQVRRLFPTKRTGVAWYHHNSEDQLQAAEVLQSYTELDAHIFVSQASRRLFVEGLAPYEPAVGDKAFVVQSGVDTCRFSLQPDQRAMYRAQYGIAEDQIVLAYAGRVIERKGLLNLFEAIARLSPSLQAKLVILIIGAQDYHTDNRNPYAQKVQTAITALGIEGQVVFTGYLAHHEMPAMLSACDVLVYPSLELEGSPLSVIEAHSLGLPVIASNVGGVGEVVQDGATGFLLDPPGDVEKMAAYMTRLITEPDLRAQMAARGRERALEHFTRERMAQDFWACIQQLNLND